MEETVPENRLREVQELPQDQKVDTICKMFQTLDLENMCKVMRYVQKNKTRKLKQVDPVPRMQMAGGSKRKAETCASAWQTPWLFRGDKVPKGGYLYLDVEKINLKKSRGQKTHQSAAATVAIVNEEGELVIWGFIKQRRQDVCQYFNMITNLSRGDLDEGMSIRVLHEILDSCLPTNTLVGFAIKDDLVSMGYPYDQVRTEDLHSFFKDYNNQPYSVKALAAEFLNGKEIQEGHHSAITDARVTLALHKVKQQKVRESDIRVLFIDIARPPKEPWQNNGEYCKCRKN